MKKILSILYNVQNKNHDIVNLLVDNRLRLIEKKMWTIAGALTIISFIVSPIGSRFVKGLTQTPQASIIEVK